MKTDKIDLSEQKESWIFELENVSYNYIGNIPALISVNSMVKKGESVFILGANGSGKSTLLEVLDGLRFPTSGIVRAYGYPLTEGTLNINRSEFARYFRSKVGLVFQNSDTQLFSPTVGEELAFGPLQLELGREDVMKRIEEVMRLLEISDLKDRGPHNLSGGEKKKVAIGSVLSMNPDVLLLDEPTNNLDPRTREWLIELLKYLQGEGKTIVAATHDLDIAKRLANRIIVLDEGHTVAANGSPEEILEDRELLADVNLIHEHTHRHDIITHRHLHSHFDDHEHSD